MFLGIWKRFVLNAFKNFLTDAIRRPLIWPDLTRWLDGRPITARPVGPIGKFARWVHREPQIASLAAAVLLVTLLGFAGVVWQWQKTVAATQQQYRAWKMLRSKASLRSRPGRGPPPRTRRTPFTIEQQAQPLTNARMVVDDRHSDSSAAQSPFLRDHHICLPQRPYFSGAIKSINEGNRTGPKRVLLAKCGGKSRIPGRRCAALSGKP